MSTTGSSQGVGPFTKKKSVHQEPTQLDVQTPESPNESSKIDLKNLERTENGLIRQFKAFVMGISGGDCAGKKELINFMFDKVQNKQEDCEHWTWKMIETGESVAVLHEHYFIKDPQNRYSAKGTDWETLKKKAISLIMGNQIKLNLPQLNERVKKVKIAPARVVCIEGSHIFGEQSTVNKILNIRVFIDSDSDVRLSRRIYKDTVQNKMPLDQSILNYMCNIKPSYEKQIEPTKADCDVVVPHFGNGYADHRVKNRSNADLNVKNITNLLLTHVRSAIKLFKDMEEEQKQVKSKQSKDLAGQKGKKI